MTKNTTISIIVNHSKNTIISRLLFAQQNGARDMGGDPDLA